MKRNFKKYISGMVSAVILISALPAMNVSADYINTTGMNELITLDMNQTENSVMQNYVESITYGATGTLKDTISATTTSKVERVDRTESDKALKMTSAGAVLNLAVPEQTYAKTTDTTIVSFDFNIGDTTSDPQRIGIGGDFWFENAEGTIEKKTAGDSTSRKALAIIRSDEKAIRTENGTYTSNLSFESNKWYNCKIVLGYTNYSIYIDGTLVSSRTVTGKEYAPYYALTGDTKTWGYKFRGIADKITITNYGGSNSIDNLSVYTGTVAQTAFAMDFTGYTGGKSFELNTTKLNSYSNESVMYSATGVCGKTESDVSQKIEWSTAPQKTVLGFAATSDSKEMFISGENGSSVLSFSFVTDGKIYPTITARGVETEPFVHTDGNTYTNGICDDALIWVRNKNNNKSIYVLGETWSVSDIAEDVWHTIVLVANYDNTYSLYYDGKPVVENHEMKNLNIRVDGDSNKTSYPAQFRGFTNLSVRSDLNEYSGAAESGYMYYDDISLTTIQNKYTIDLTDDVYSVVGETISDNTLGTVSLAKTGFVSPDTSVYAASYEANGRLFDVKYAQILSGALPGEKEISFNLSIPEGGTHKVFAWNKNTLTPLMSFGAKSASASEDKTKLFVLAASCGQTYHADTRNLDWKYPRAGFGQMLSKFFGDGIIVSNKAMSGESAKSFYNKYWASIKEDIEPGDYVIIQFGGNDRYKTGKDDLNAVNATNPTLSSSQEYFETIDEYTSETEYYMASHYSFKWYLKQYIDDIREKGGIPILGTYSDRYAVSEGSIAKDTIYEPWHTAVKEMGTEMDVPVLDVNGKWRTLMTSFDNAEMAKNYYLYIAKNDVRFANDEQFDETEYWVDVDGDGVLGTGDQIDVNADGTWETIDDITVWDGILLKDITHYNTYSAEIVAQMIVQSIKEHSTLSVLAEHINDYNPSCPWDKLQFK